MGMTLKELYERMDGSEIEERIALMILDNPETQEKLKKDKEAERVKNLSPEEQVAMVMKILAPNKGKK